MKCDKGVSAKRGKWEFNGNVASEFNEHVKKSVPAYEQVQDMVCELSDWFVSDNSLVYDLGAATGTTVKKLHEHNKHKNVRYVLIDCEKAMLDKARANLKETDNNLFLPMRIEEAKIDDASLVICLYTLHFVPPEHRQSVLNAIYTGLKEGGALILVE